MESESSAKAGSMVSSGSTEDPPLTVREPWASRKDVRELGLKGVVGREDGG